MYSVSIKSPAAYGKAYEAWIDNLKTLLMEGVIEIRSMRIVGDAGYSLLVALHGMNKGAEEWLAEQFPEQAIMLSLQPADVHYIVTLTRQDVGDLLLAMHLAGKR
jgi:hypothetical protein